MIETTRSSWTVPPPGRRRRAAALALVLALGPGAGCGREFFRNWADQDVTEAVFEKSRDPRWRLDTFSIEPPSLSRYADPYDPDRPPAPPDDRAAEALSPVPQWPHHRLLVPVEGTGYADMLDAWQRQRPTPSLTETVPDSGPSAVAPVAPPPPPGAASPFGHTPIGPEPLLPESILPEPNSGPEIPGLSPIIPGGRDDTPTLPRDRDAVPPPAPDTTTHHQDPGVHLAALQLPTPPAPGPAELPTPAETSGATPLELPGLEPADPGRQVPADPRLDLKSELLQPTDGAGVTDLAAILNPGPIPFDEADAAGLPRDSRPYVVNPEQALTLALTNSRGYQFRLENVYIVGLNVTLQRFQFEPQFFAGLQPQTPTVAGLLAPNPGNVFTYRTREAPGGQVSTLNIGTAAGFGKLLSFGTRIAGGFANQTIFNFTGGNARRPTVQSFLPLTVVQPFLRGGGRALTLEALTQAERDLLYEVRDFARFRQEFFPSILAGEQVSATGLADPAIGYLQLLQQRQIVENDTKNVAAFERVLSVYRTLAESPAAGLSPLDIVQIENSLQRARNSLLNDRNQYRSLLDQYKIQLGMPPDVPLLPDIGLLQGFRDVFARIDLLEVKPRETLERLVQELPQLEEVIVDGRPSLSLIQESARLETELRLDALRLVDLQLAERAAIQLLETDPQEAQRRLSPLAAQRKEIAERTGRLSARRLEIERRSVDQLEDLLLSSERVALENRLDLMNTRAQLYDTWRQLAVRANQLKGIFNVIVTNQFVTPSTTTNPFGFNDQSKQFSLVLNAELPLVRLADRNNYIQAHIDYNRGRRELMFNEDRVKLQIRQAIRNLQVLARQYEIQKVLFIASLQQSDQSLQNIVAPPAQAGGGGGAQGSNVSTITLTNALNGVNGAQSTLVATWVNYQTQRLALYRDLGIMPYDEWEAFYELFPSADAGPAAPRGGARPAAPAASRAPQGVAAH